VGFETCSERLVSVCFTVTKKRICNVFTEQDVEGELPFCGIQRGR